MSVNLLLESSVPPPGISKPMTAGADPQPVESSTAPKMPSITSIRNIPHILDHNYGQPPPMTPPDSNSPGPEDIDTGNEDEEDDGVTRCICGFDHDDGYMICCDKCSVWQHIECMGISSDAVPESYLCDQCQPRTLDRVRARAIQERKKEELSDDDDDDEESEEERDTPSYTAISNTPTRITLTTKVTRKRKRGSAKMKVKQDVNILTDGLEKPKKPKRRRRSKQQKPPTTTFVPVDEETSEPWDSNCNSFDQYEEVKENIYSQELEQLALNSIQENGISPAYDGDEQRCKVAEVQRCRKGIVTTEDMDKNSFIIQCKGKVMLLSRFESENQFFKRFFPFVLYYSKLDHLQLCVDARTRGNDARFVRRSCCPTAEVKHYFHNGRVCLGIFSTCPLPTGHEVTIPFEFPFDEYHSNLDCACAQDGCAVTKYNSRFQNQNHDTPAHKRFKAHDEDSNSSHNQKMSPLRVSLSNSQGLQGDSDSDIENNPENRRKKSREERKLEAYLKQIEKMEKKEKRKQQTQKEHKHEVISPVSQEVTVNKLGAAKSLSRGMKRSFNKRRSGMPGLKKRHGRLSSCSSEPLSPEEHSSTASTPTTPKVTSASSLPDEPCYVTPSSSPNRNFKFPKGTKQCVDEDFKETPIRETPIREPVKVETAEHSGASSPNSPVYTPREDVEMKPVLSTASSTTDLTPEGEPAVCESTVPVSVPVSVPEPVSVCTSTADSGNLGKDFSQSLTECLVEINSTVGSGRNTPSPCPSTTGSPTSAESVTSGYSGSAAERTSPGPAPGSPVASVKFGQRAARSNPLYGSLKKRWLFQYLCEQKLVNDRPPNGFKVAVTATITTPMNGKTIPSSVRRNGLPKILDPLPLKKRHLKKYQSTCSEPTEPAVTVTEPFVASEPACDEPLIVSSPVALEQQVQIVLADSVNDLQPHKEEQAPSIEQLSLREETKPLRVDTSAVSNSFETSNSTVIVTHTTGIGVTTSSVTISQRRPSDPRLVNISPVGSTYPVFPPSSGGIVAALSVTSPVGGMLAGQSASPFGQSGEFSSGTPGKKKVSLLEYRNRSRNRLSIDTPRTAPPHPSPVAASSVVSPAVFSPSVIKSSASLPNLSLSASSSSVHRPVVSSGDVNGPHLEPVSPDVDDKSSGLLSRFTRMANSAHPYARASHSMRGEGRVMLYNEGDSRLKREIQKKHELLTKREEGKARLNEKLTSIISVQLQKDTKSTPSVAVRSPSTSSSDSSHHPLELSGDAMEIEDEDSNSNSNMNIYINTPVVPASVHAHSAPVSHRPSLLAQLTQPNYRLNIPVSHGSSQPPIYLSTGSPQLPSPSQPPQRLSGSSPQYLVTSPSGPAHVRFQSPYQTAPSQPAGYYHH